MTKEFDLKETLKSVLSKVVLLVVIFYLIYPQALSFMGSTAIMAFGPIGILLYVANKFPFRKEVFTVLCAFVIYLLICHISSHLNGTYDYYLFAQVKKQIGELFTAYIVVYLLFKIYKTPSVNLLIAFMVAAIVLQCVITLVMYFNADVSDFFYSIQHQAELDLETRDRVKHERLIGYGTAFFGAGIIAGYGLILTMYLLLKVKMKLEYLILTCVSFALIFYVGLFSARTTVIGLALSLALFGIIFLSDKGKFKSQTYRMVVILIGLIVAGVSLAYFYFPNFAGWAFELFTTYSATGELYTDSSSGLGVMTYAPEDFFTFMIGTGSMGFFGSDVGFTRLLYYVGVIGTVAFFGYSLFLAFQSFIKDWHFNLLLLLLFVHGMAMNVKGLAEINHLFYMFFFYFVFYKHYIYYPQFATLVKNPFTGKAKIFDKE